MTYQGILLSVSAPSGTGKTSLVKALLERHRDVEVSISHTTRAMRPGEIDGRHYHFVSPSRFQDLVHQEAFVEYAKVFDHYYGTSKSAVAGSISAGKDVLLDIDWQGALAAKRIFPENAVSVFLLPPSREALEYRLRSRAQDSDEVIARRMAAADAELAQSIHYDYWIVNDDFERALDELESIILSERCRPKRQIFRHREVFHRLGMDTQ